MQTAEVWKQLFNNWPAGLSNAGVAVSVTNEQIPFGNFFFNDKAVVLERHAPDAVGGRKVILPFESITAVKITDPAKPQVFVGAGYTNASARKPRAAAPAPPVRAISNPAGPPQASPGPQAPKA